MGTNEPSLAALNTTTLLQTPQGYKPVKADHKPLDGLFPGELLGQSGEPIASVQKPKTRLSDWESFPRSPWQKPHYSALTLQ